MKTILSVFAVVLFAVMLIGCTGALDRTIDGEPKYDTNGEKVGGDDLYIDEVLEYQSIMAVIKSLDTKPSGNEVISSITDANGRMLVYIVNNSNQRFNIIVKNSRGTQVLEANIGPHSYTTAYMVPGKGFVASYDHSRFYKYFDLMPNLEKLYELIYRDGSRETMSCGEYFDKNR